MARVKMFRIQINLDSADVGETVFWTHKGKQWVSTVNRPQAGLLFEDEIESIRSNGFHVEIIDEVELDDLS